MDSPYIHYLVLGGGGEFELKKRGGGGLAVNERLMESEMGRIFFMKSAITSPDSKAHFLLRK